MNQIFTRQETIFQSLQISLLFLFFYKALNFLKNVIFARVLGPTEFGLLTLYLMIIYIIKQAATFGIGAAHTRYAPEFRSRDTLRYFFVKTFSRGSALITCTAVAVFLFSRPMAQLVFKNPDAKMGVISTILVIVPFAFLELYLSALQGLQNFRAKSLLQFSCSALFLIFGTFSVLTVGRAQGVIWAMAATYILVAALFSWHFWSGLTAQPYQPHQVRGSGFFRRLSSFCLFIFLTDISLQIYQFIDRFMLSQFLTKETVGIYTSCLTMTGIIFPIGLILSEVLLPNLSALWAQGKVDEGQKKFYYHVKLLVIALLLFSVPLLALKRHLIIFLFGMPYLDGVKIAPFLIAFHVYNSIYWVLAVVPLLVEQTHFLFVITLSGIVINSTLNYLLIPLVGMKGAALGSMITAIVMLLTTIVFLYRKFKQVDISLLLLLLLPLVNLIDSLNIHIGLLIFTAYLVFRTNRVFTRAEKVQFWEHLNLYRKNLGGLFTAR